jgi:DUF4097 and DUF4098 domain-containing protein YvlB
MKRFSLSVIAAIIVVPLYAATFNVTDRSNVEYPIDADGSLWIDDPFGNVEIVGVNSSTLTVSIVKVTAGVDNAAIGEGRAQTVLQTTGDERVRIMKVILPEAPRSPRWRSFVTYTVKAPKSLHVKVSSMYSDRIRIADMTGDVTVKNVTGEIVLDNVAGTAVVDTANGNITYKPVGRPAANTQLATVNGRIQIVVPPEAAFQWVADTIQGDFRTTMPIQKPRFVGRTLRALVNAATSPVMTTSSLTGDVLLLRTGTTEQQAHSVRQIAGPSSNASDSTPVFSTPVLTRHFQAPVVDGNLQFVTNIGDVTVSEVRGNARVETGAGQVQLSTVAGECNVISHGGEIDLGDIRGPLMAHTDAGNVTVNMARFGGTVTTGGGMIRVLMAGNSMVMKSGGGDIVVRDARGPVVAETRSGDVTVTVAGNVQSGAVQASTGRGNIVLNVRPQFAADVDATIITSDPDANDIDSDLNGLSVKRESVGRRTKIHATGKLNGGGPRVYLYAEEGDIHINTQTPVIVSPQVP